MSGRRVEIRCGGRPAAAELALPHFIYQLGNTNLRYIVKIMFRTYRIEALCSNPKALRRKYGLEGARKIEARLSDLEEAGALEDMRLLPGRCHELTR